MFKIYFYLFREGRYFPIAIKTWFFARAKHVVSVRAANQKDVAKQLICAGFFKRQDMASTILDRLPDVDESQGGRVIKAVFHRLPLRAFKFTKII